MSKFKVSSIFYSFLLVLCLGIFAPPLLMKAGAASVAQAGYFAYGFLCHQLPERSFFLFGEQLSYSPQQLSNLGYQTEWIVLPHKRFPGDGVLGYKLAVCARDTGIYLGLIAGGLACLIVADPLRRYGLKQYNGMVYVRGWRLLLTLGLALPMVLDGGTQFIAYAIDFTNPFYMSNNLLRVVTGFGFGLVVGIWAFAMLKFNEEVPERNK